MDPLKEINIKNVPSYYNISIWTKLFNKVHIASYYSLKNIHTFSI